jgi:hypothetical protein
MADSPPQPPLSTEALRAARLSYFVRPPTPPSDRGASPVDPASADSSFISAAALTDLLLGPASYAAPTPSSPLSYRDTSPLVPASAPSSFISAAPAFAQTSALAILQTIIVHASDSDSAPASPQWTQAMQTSFEFHTAVSVSPDNLMKRSRRRVMLRLMRSDIGNGLTHTAAKETPLFCT